MRLLICRKIVATFPFRYQKCSNFPFISFTCSNLPIVLQTWSSSTNPLLTAVSNMMAGGSSILPVSACGSGIAGRGRFAAAVFFFCILTSLLFCFRVWKVRGQRRTQSHDDLPPVPPVCAASKRIRRADWAIRMSGRIFHKWASNEWVARASNTSERADSCESATSASEWLVRASDLCERATSAKRKMLFVQIYLLRLRSECATSSGSASISGSDSVGSDSDDQQNRDKKKRCQSHSQRDQQLSLVWHGLGSGMTPEAMTRQWRIPQIQRSTSTVIAGKIM